MGVKAQNQITLIDITDAYSVILSNENQTFRETSYNSGTTATTTTTTVYSYRGSTNVYAYLPNSAIGSTHANNDGVYLTIESPATNPAQDLEITIHIPSGLTASGSIEIPIELYETSTTTGDPLTTFTKEFSYSVARYGSTGAAATIYGLDTTGVLFNFDHATNTYVSPQTITISATIQTGNNPVVKSNEGILRITPYQSNGTAGTVTLVNLATATNHEYTLSPNSTYLYYVIELNIGGTINGSTISGGTIVDKQTISTCMQGADGEDAYSIDITSSGGFVFKNTNAQVILTAHVYKGGVELAAADLATLGLGVFWYEGSTKKNNSSSLTLTIGAGAVTSLMHLTAKLETLSS